MCSKSTSKTPKWRCWLQSSVFLVNSEQIIPRTLLILNKFLFTRKLEIYYQLKAGNLSTVLKLQRNIFFCFGVLYSVYFGSMSGNSYSFTQHLVVLFSWCYLIYSYHFSLLLLFFHYTFTLASYETQYIGFYTPYILPSLYWNQFLTHVILVYWSL